MNRKVVNNFRVALTIDANFDSIFSFKEVWSTTALGLQTTPESNPSKYKGSWKGSLGLLTFRNIAQNVSFAYKISKFSKIFLNVLPMNFWLYINHTCQLHMYTSIVLPLKDNT